jgi:phosphatidylserine decarboxylase
MKQVFSRTLWRWLPKRAMSRWMGKLARHPFSRHFIRGYVRYFNIDLAPVKRPLHEFENLLDFFVRELHPEARPVVQEKGVVVSPVDGTVSEIGVAEQGMLLQAKGVHYSLEELLGGHTEFVQKFSGGPYVTIYLSPRDYHRIHMPVEGVVEELTYIPGELYPVNQTGVKLFPGLFVKNERVISYIRSDFGQMALVKVGATNVGSIRVTYDRDIVTNPRRVREIEHKKYGQPVHLEKGDEMGRFEFGSTVILLFEPGQIEWMIETRPGVRVQMGEGLARFVGSVERK